MLQTVLNKQTKTRRNSKKKKRNRQTNNTKGVKKAKQYKRKSICLVSQNTLQARYISYSPTGLPGGAQGFTNLLYKQLPLRRQAVVITYYISNLKLEDTTATKIYCPLQIIRPQSRNFEIKAFFVFFRDCQKVS